MKRRLQAKRALHELYSWLRHPLYFLEGMAFFRYIFRTGDV